MKRTQEDYFIHHSIPRDTYETRMEGYRIRLAEIEEDLHFLQGKLDKYLALRKQATQGTGGSRVKRFIRMAVFLGKEKINQIIRWLHRF